MQNNSPRNDKLRTDNKLTKQQPKTTRPVASSPALILMCPDMESNITSFFYKRVIDIRREPKLNETTRAILEFPIIPQYLEYFGLLL